MERKVFLLTGAAGFIGSNLAHFLTSHGHTAVVYDKLTYAGNLSSLEGIPQDKFAFVHGDVCDTELVYQTLCRYGIDAVFHLAAESHVDRSIDGPSAFIETNINGTFSMLAAARRYYETLTKSAKAGSGSCTYRPTKSTAAWAIRDISQRKRHTPRTPHTPLLKLRPTI